MTVDEYWDPREEPIFADIFCSICGECKSWVETTEAIGFGIYRKVWLCEDCDVAPAGYPT
jgi:hypothetical protein